MQSRSADDQFDWKKCAKDVCRCIETRRASCRLRGQRNAKLCGSCKSFRCSAFPNFRIPRAPIRCYLPPVLSPRRVPSSRWRPMQQVASSRQLMPPASSTSGTFRLRGALRFNLNANFRNQFFPQGVPAPHPDDLRHVSVEIAIANRLQRGRQKHRHSVGGSRQHNQITRVVVACD